MKRIFSTLISILVMVSALSGCRSAWDTEASATVAPDKAMPTTVTTTLKIAGSTSVAPLMKELKATYEETYKNITIEIQESGSSAGITATIEGASDIGMSSRDLTQEEKDKGLLVRSIALDGIAVIVNNENPVVNLTKEQIISIYKGEITNWKDVGGDDGDIIVVSREEGSGTRGAYEELLKLEREVENNGKKLKESLLTLDAIFENSTGAVKTNVAGSKNAIGYISLGTIDDTVKALQVDGVTCSEETILDHSYSIARSFIVCTMGEPKTESQHLIDFILSDKGQEIVSQHHYVKVQ